MPAPRNLVTPDEIMEFDLDSDPIEAPDRPLYKERFIHGEIYKARPDVVAVVHNHSPFVVSFSVSSVPLRALAHSGAFIGDRLPIFEIRGAGGMTDMLVSSPALGRALAQTLGDKPALLMRGHGAVTVGPNLPHAVGRSIYLEVNAKLQAQAIALGASPIWTRKRPVRWKRDAIMGGPGSCGSARRWSGRFAVPAAIPGCYAE